MPMHGTAGPQREVHDLGDLLGEDLAERAAEHRRVVAEDEHLPALDRSPAGDHPVAADPPFLHAEVGRPVQREHVELGERAGVEHPVDALARGELALGVLGALGGAAAVDGVVPPLAQQVDLLAGATTRSTCRRSVGVGGPGRRRKRPNRSRRREGRLCAPVWSPRQATRGPHRASGSHRDRGDGTAPKTSRSTPHTSPTVACASSAVRINGQQVGRSLRTALATHPARAPPSRPTGGAQLREPLDLRRFELGADARGSATVGCDVSVNRLTPTMTRSPDSTRR